VGKRRGNGKKEQVQSPSQFFFSYALRREKKREKEVWRGRKIRLSICAPFFHLYFVTAIIPERANGGENLKKKEKAPKTTLCRPSLLLRNR